MSTFSRVFAGAAFVWAGLLPAAPYAASQPAPAPVWYALAFIVYGAGGVVCHQLAERSFHLFGAQMPVCARCAGLYAGGALAALAALVWSPDARNHRGDIAARDRPGRVGARARSARVLLAVSALPTAATLLYEWTSGDTPSNGIRALAGAPLGVAVALVVLEAVRPTTHARAGGGKVN